MDALKPIATIRSDFTTKFGIPRQSGLAAAQLSTIVFESEYRDENALRGLDGYSHIWLIWGFSEVKAERWSPMVKPPRLGGNKRMGVFATRSPYRPNPIGLSSVKLERIEKRQNLGTVLIVSGADLMDGTPIYDIKPYVKFTDSHPEAKEGFTAATYNRNLKVIFPSDLLAIMPENKQTAAVKILEQDPRPAYDTDESRAYGVTFSGFDIRFKVHGDVLTVFEVVDIEAAGGYKKVK